MLNTFTSFIGNDPPIPEVKTFTQEQVNVIMAENKRGLQDQLKAVTLELEKSKTKGGDSKALETKIAELTNSLLTKEEMAKQTLDRISSESETKVKALSDEKDAYRTRYHETLINQAIVSAGAKHLAYDPAQLMLLFGNKAEVVEVTDDQGKGTNVFKVQLPVVVEGKVVKMDADQAIEQLRKDKAFGNLFKTDVVGGTGFTLNNNNSATVDKTIALDTATYMANRSAYKKAGLI